MINPNVVEGQIAGGAVQGIGGALYEHLAYDDDGNPVATTFMDYLLPTATEVPMIEYGHIETPEPRSRGLQGRRRGRRHRRAARGRQRGRRRARAVRRDGDPAAADPVADRGAARREDQPHDRTGVLRPVRRRDRRRSVPGVPAAARGGAALLQRARTTSTR